MVFDPLPSAPPTSHEDAGGGGVATNGAGTTAAKTPRLRKGMVLAVPSQHMVASGLSLQAVSGLTALFDADNGGVAALSVGALVNVYVASVRSAARVVRVSRVESQNGGSGGGKKVAAADEIEEGLFGLAEDMEVESASALALDAAAAAAADGGLEVQLELLSTREWVELGSRILVLEGGRQDRSGLEGFVGKVVEIVE
jgi:hypothetical protein